VRFCQRLNSTPLGAKYRFRLPTDAEWEYACRAGTKSIFYWGNDPSQLPLHAWSVANSGKSVKPVGKLRPNPWGFYDLLGNVSEWTSDWRSALPTTAQRDPQGPAEGKVKSHRGANMLLSDPTQFRSASIGGNPPFEVRDYLGFRLAADPQ
jgi:formylglycine-generating enzyme required for sulfatase activity